MGIFLARIVGGGECFFLFADEVDTDVGMVTEEPRFLTNAYDAT